MLKRRLKSLVVMVCMFSFSALSPGVVLAGNGNNQYNLGADEHTWDTLRAIDIIQGAGDKTDLDSVNLRVSYDACPGNTRRLSDALDQNHIDVVKDSESADYFRIKLNTNQTTLCYNSSEIYLGQSLYFGQTDLQDANARGDIRIFKPGTEMKVKARWSANYANGTALGNAGIIGQGWEFGPGYGGNKAIYVGYNYLPNLPQFGLPASIYAVVVDFSTGYLNLRPVTHLINDPTAWHDYSVKWYPGNTFDFLVDGNVIRHVDASTRMRTTGDLFTHVGIWLDNNDFSAGLTNAGTGSIFTEEHFLDAQSFKVLPLE